MDRVGSVPGTMPAWGWGAKSAGPQQHQEPASIQAPPPARWIRCHPSCRARSSWTPRGCPPGPLGRGGRAPPALPGPDAALPGARLGTGQGLSQMPWSRPVQVRGVPRGRSDEVCNVQGIPAETKAAEEMPALFRCNTCSGRGSKTCVTCRGEKKLQHFKQVVIRWKNNVFEFVSEHHLNFPRELLGKVSGENIFKDENVVVYPIIDFPDPEISLASQRAVAEHSAAFAVSSRILRQRQTIELIPITEVHCQYSGKPYLYYIYGLENEVHALDYPERCCCGCTVI
ncbi:protein SSUH2 homolog isoform X1 [Harpia harpyja]|uniref:protein SSUH2 homolog isoform X1 n=1 Tax=Harpia harpyja TaxID=202280 RepID=UPI0022B146BB|nr:protein SSUH2 homolog isoform X1 [Harpia harpyja]